MMVDVAAGFAAHEIEEAVAGRLVGGRPDMTASGVSTDSRTLRAGELFVPIAGLNFDGHDFIAAGCLAGPGRSPEVPENAFAVEVEDTLRALGDLARYHRGRFDLPVVAVTGSNGKTTTKEMIAAILAEGAETLKSEGNLNNLIGLPLQVFGLGPAHERAVFEMGMNQPGEIFRLAEIAAPEVAVITGVAPAHLEGLGSIEAVRDAKGEVLEAMGAAGTAVLPSEDPHCGVLAERFRSKGGRAVTFGFSAGCDARAGDIQMTARGGTSFRIYLGGEEAEARLPVVGKQNVLNALAAAAAASHIGSSLDEVVRGLARAEFPRMRLAIEEIPGGAFLLNDAYNANPESLRLAIQTACELKGTGRAFGVLGDMKELGAFEKSAHREAGRWAAKEGLDYLAAVGAMMKLAAEEARGGGMSPDRVGEFAAPEEAAAWVADHLEPGDWVLVKGSRSMEMERAAEALRD
ncbi:UDP-N-acetylmuramoyl-tripeptide--D-alanyl-D-alanine ligase [Nitrospinota bacterium]